MYIVEIHIIVALQHPWFYHTKFDPISPNSVEHKGSFRACDDICEGSKLTEKNNYYSRNLHMRSNTMTKSPQI